MLFTKTIERRDTSSMLNCLKRKCMLVVSKRSAFRVWPFLVLTGQVYSSLRAMRNYQTLPEIVPVITDDRVCMGRFPWHLNHCACA